MLSDNKFFKFIKPLLNYIDKGNLYKKPFGWLYVIIAVINLLIPLFIIISLITEGLFNGPFKEVLAIILVWFSITFAGWISFQIWWDRKSIVLGIGSEKDEFVATPVFAHFIKTLGEWIGTWVAIVGFLLALMTTIILGGEGSSISRELGLEFLGSGAIFIILSPVIGFLIIVLFKFISELISALSAIANNTK